MTIPDGPPCGNVESLGISEGETLDDPQTQHVKSAWKSSSSRLTRYVLEHLVNRSDAYGAYTGTNKQFTAKDRLTEETLARHFAAESARDVVGLHTTLASEVEGPDGEMVVSCTSRWCTNDIDHHGEGEAPYANFNTALATHESLIEMGFRPLLVDTNGRGGFRNFVIFSEPIRTDLAYHLIRWVQSLWAELGMASEPEAFPKQPGIPLDGYGNWVRLFGRHHKREHYTRFWDDGEWLGGQDAIDHLLDHTGDDPALIPRAVYDLADAGAVRHRATSAGNEKDFNDLAIATEALAFLKAMADDYDSWITIGQCLTPLGEPGLQLWDSWSRTAQNGTYREGECRTKWDSFREPGDVGGRGGRGLGTLLKLAEDRGFGGHKAVPLNLKKGSNQGAKPAVNGFMAKEKAQAEEDAKLDALLDAYRPKTFGTIAKSIGELEHLWDNWLILGNVSMIWSKPKIGKTRVYIGLIKYLWFATAFPDGAANRCPAGTKTLVIPYDRNHSEIANEMRLAGIPDDAAVCPYDPRDETGVSLMSLTDPYMLRLLEKIVEGDRAIKLIVIDTLTYASEKSLSKPEDMKAILDGIMELAARHKIAVLILIHENKEGGALGVRITERARVLMRLERYNENEPTRLRLFVKESNFPTRPALTVIHGDNGVSFEPDKGETGRQPDRAIECARWLGEFMWMQGEGVQVHYGKLIDAAGYAGYAGEYDEGARRWSNRNLLSRAIDAINGKSVPDLQGIKIDRIETPNPGKPKPTITYALRLDVG